MRKNGLTFIVFAMIITTDILESIAELSMKKGLLKIGMDNINGSNVLEFVLHSAGSWLIWLGIIFYTLNFFIWITVLSRVELSVALPVGSTSYIFVPILAMMFLGENVGIIRWIGIALIIAGIHFVSKSMPHDTKISNAKQ